MFSLALATLLSWHNSMEKYVLFCFTVEFLLGTL